LFLFAVHGSEIAWVFVAKLEIIFLKGGTAGKNGKFQISALRYL
jgi:hypothetical protein